MIAVASAPTLAEVRAWTGVTVASMSDDQLQHVLDTEVELQAACCSVDPYGDALHQAALRRCARHIAARGLPLGLTGESETGPVRLPTYDVEIERLEAPCRVIAVA